MLSFHFTSKFLQFLKLMFIEVLYALLHLHIQKVMM